jgi:hypothetical protein
MLSGKSSQSTTPFTNLRYDGISSEHFSLIKTFLEYKWSPGVSYIIPIFSEWVDGM